MKQITKTFKVYKFEELSEEIKEKVIEKHRQNSYNDNWHIEDLQEQFSEELKENLFPNEEIGFNFDYGGAVSFKGNIEIENFLKKHRKFTEFKKLFSEKVYSLSATIEKDNRGDSISLSVEMELDLNEYEDALRSAIIEKERTELETLRDKLEDYLGSEMDKMRSKLIKWGREHFDYVYSNEAVIENIEANEYEFLEDGEQF